MVDQVAGTQIVVDQVMGVQMDQVAGTQVLVDQVAGTCGGSIGRSSDKWWIKWRELR